MQFTGDIEDRCPISFSTIRDIENPVGFDDKHAFECGDLVEWLTQHKPTNPMTSASVHGLVADILHPLIVEGDDSHVDETRLKLDRAGCVLSLDRSDVRDAAVFIRINMIVFAVVVYFLSLHKLHLGSVFAVGCSFAHLLNQTCKVYPVHGKLIMLNFLMVSACALAIVEVSGICSPGTHWTTKVAIPQGVMLVARLMLDTDQVMRAELRSNQHPHTVPTPAQNMPLAHAAHHP
jgi:hypothetical protein